MFLFIIGIIVLLAGLIGGIILMCNDEKAYGIGGLAGGLVLGVLCIVLACTTNISTGHTGIVTVFGRVESTTLDAGLHGKAPWQSIVKMDNRVQKETVELSCFSSDLQEVSVKYTLNYQINKQTASEIYKTIGQKYEDIAVTPTVAESVKTVVAKFTAEALIANRTVLAAGVKNYIEKLKNEKWDGKLPVYMMGTDSTVTVVTP